METDNVKAVKEWKTPTKIKEVESFLEFANFYRRFIKNFSHMARPLNELKGKKRVEMGRRTTESIQGIEGEDNKSTGSRSSEKRGKFQVETDASWHATEGVLSQEQDGKWKPIAFLSRIMQLAEQNYEIYDKELLAIVKAITKWRQYLLNTIEKFEVWTDHENLKYFWEPHKLNGRQARWYLKLQDYDFIL